MKVSLNWVRQFTDIELSTDELVKKIGEQLGAVEEVIDLAPIYKDVVVAEVKVCEKHPDADKLNVCMVDDGGVVENVDRTDGLVQVVCGAPNVKAGMKVAWLPPGSTVPSTIDKEPFVLEARELRGKISNGMLASLKELAIGEEHEGIAEIDVAAENGQKFADVYQLNDVVIDIENKMFTHRPDCFGQLGVAREIAGISHKTFKSPDWYLNPLDRIKISDNRLPLTVQNEIPDLVKRFVCVPIADISVKKSPIMVQSFLSRVGVKPINNIVDITNYIMLLTGQPLHAYDYDKVAQRTSGEGALLKAAHGNAEQKVKLLNGKTLVPRKSDIVIATDSEVVGIGGVMGGSDTEVDENTKNIILECANFDMYTIRRTSMGLGLFTDAVTRFNKGQSPLQNDTVLEEAVAMIQSYAGGDVAGHVQDAKGEVDFLGSVEVEADFVAKRLGEVVAADDIASLLSNVEFNVSVHGETVKIIVPFWRTDIDIREDIVEEVGRLLGFHHLPITLPHRSIQPVHKNSSLEFKSKMRHALVSAGANELLTYSFVHGDVLHGATQDETQAYKIGNALSPDLQFYRMSVTPSLLDKVYGNIRAGHKDFCVFEIGKAHKKGEQDPNEPTVPNEEELLSFVISSSKKSKQEEPAFYRASAYIDALFGAIGVAHSIEPMGSLNEDVGQQVSAVFDVDRTAVVKVANQSVGFVGEYKNSVRKAFKLPTHTAGFEVAIDMISGSQMSCYAQLSKFPSVEQDISLKIPDGLRFGELRNYLNDNFEVGDDRTWSLKPIDIYQQDGEKHATFRLKIASYQKTMRAEEVNALLDELAEKAAQELGTKRL